MSRWQGRPQPATVPGAQSRPPVIPPVVLPLLPGRCQATPARGQPVPPKGTLLPALLHVGPDEFLGVLLEHLVDLVQDRVDVVSQLVLPLAGLISLLDIRVHILLGSPLCLALNAGVLRRHALPPCSAVRPQSQRYPGQPVWRPTLTALHWVSRADNSWPE